MSHVTIIINGDVKIGRRGRNAAVPGGIADLGQCTPAGHGVADECVPAMVDRHLMRPLGAQGLAGGPEAEPQAWPDERPPASAGNLRADEQVAAGRSLPFPFAPPRLDAVSSQRVGAYHRGILRGLWPFPTCLATGGCGRSIPT
jgi:hypothetical protein